MLSQHSKASRKPVRQRCGCGWAIVGDQDDYLSDDQLLQEKQRRKHCSSHTTNMDVAALRYRKYLGQSALQWPSLERLNSFVNKDIHIDRTPVTITLTEIDNGPNPRVQISDIIGEQDLEKHLGQMHTRSISGQMPAISRREPFSSFDIIVRRCIRHQCPVPC